MQEKFSWVQTSSAESYLCGPDIPGQIGVFPNNSAEKSGSSIVSTGFVWFASPRHSWYG
jgi:hypothetical protein